MSVPLLVHLFFIVPGERVAHGQLLCKSVAEEKEIPAFAGMTMLRVHSYVFAVPDVHSRVSDVGHVTSGPHLMRDFYSGLALKAKITVNQPGKTAARRLQRRASARLR